MRSPLATNLPHLFNISQKYRVLVSSLRLLYHCMSRSVTPFIYYLFASGEMLCFLTKRFPWKKNWSFVPWKKNEENIKSNYMKPTEIFASYIEMGTESETWSYFFCAKPEIQEQTRSFGWQGIIGCFSNSRDKFCVSLLTLITLCQFFLVKSLWCLSTINLYIFFT